MASPDHSGRLTLSLARSVAILLLGVAVGLAGAACDRQAGRSDDWSLSIDVTPPRPIVDQPAQVAVELLQTAREGPWPGARLQVEAHMDHPGMAPVIAPAADRGNGAYRADLTFTMAGSWIIFVTGELPDGRRIRSRVSSPVDVTAAGG